MQNKNCLSILPAFSTSCLEHFYQFFFIYLFTEEKTLNLFCRFLRISGLTDCDYYKTDEYIYTKYVDLKTIRDAQPDGYYARIPVYLIGPRDGHIVLSTTDSTALPFVYEFGTVYLFYLFVLFRFNQQFNFKFQFFFENISMGLVFGGYGNTKLMIRKRVQNYPIKEIVLSSVVSELRPLKVVLEVSKGKNEIMKQNSASSVEINAFTCLSIFNKMATFECSPITKLSRFSKHLIHSCYQFNI